MSWYYCGGTKASFTFQIGANAGETLVLDNT